MRPFSLVLAVIAVLAAGCDAAPEHARAEPDRAAPPGPQPVPPGTAPRGAAEYRAAVAAPGPVARRAAQPSGAERYAIHCVPCHGAGGAGDGPVTRAGFPRPPSFHEERLAALEPPAIVAVIGEGKGRMLPMAERVPPDERWAIADYVKSLQRDAGARASGGGARPP